MEAVRRGVRGVRKQLNVYRLTASERLALYRISIPCITLFEGLSHSSSHFLPSTPLLLSRRPSHITEYAIDRTLALASPTSC